MSVTPTMLALCAAAPALGQSWTWLADVSADDIHPGDEVVVTISALMEAEAPFVALSAFNFEVANILDPAVGHITDYVVLNNFCDLGQNFVWSDGVGVYEVQGGQLNVFGPFTSDNPVDVLEFTFVADEPGVAQFESLSIFTFVWMGDDKEAAAHVEVDRVNEASFTITVIPAPSAAVLLTPLARRRRR